MSDRFSYLYQPADKFDLLALLDGWASNGVLLKNPATERTTLLSQDGEQVDVSVQELVSAVSSHADFTFQLWVSADTDLCCRIRFLNDSRLVEEYSLVGIGRRLGEIVGMLLQRFKAKADESNKLFFVVDREGYTIEIDWDRLSVIGKYEDRICPDILVFPENRAIDFKSCAEGDMVSVRLGQYVILKRITAK